MIRKFFLFCLLTVFPVILRGQFIVPDSLISLFNNQLTVFPQEKIYLHTDKPYYISGERIWFRAHIADAMTHIPCPVSRYVYVELINPLDTVVTRVKILQDNDACHGYLIIPEDVPEGDYTIRAYTMYMRNQDEHFLCTKTIRISDPQSRTIHTETRFTFESDRRIHAEFRFSHVSSSAPVVPQSAQIAINSGKMMNVKIDDDGVAGVNFNLPADSRQRVILLEIEAFQVRYRQFIQVPAPDDDFDVSFFPEGGSAMQGARCKIAFKVMKSNGQSCDVTGVIYDQSGTEIQEIKSDHLGMGYFLHFAEKGKNYYAICTNERGHSKRFELPAAADRGYALSVTQLNENMFVTVLNPNTDLLGLKDTVGLAEGTKPAGFEKPSRFDELYLLAHTRGMVHFAELWDHEKNIASFRKEQFPTGVLHFILFDAGLNPVSERLVFINNNDQVQAVFQSDQEQFSARSLVQNQITISDSDGQPLVGNFSVSVTSDKEVLPDSTSNILTQLLLTSDLYGYVENPAYYFENTLESAHALDLLMRTQGWRRYNIAELTQGRFSQPAFLIETGAEMSGTVKSVLLGKPAEKIEVTVLSLKGDYFEYAITDQEGRFYFYDGEFPDSTRFMVNAIPAKSMSRLELIMDQATFPERTLPADPPLTPVDRQQLAKYADKAEQQYVSEGGIRLYHIAEITVTAERKQRIKSEMYSEPDLLMTEDEIERTNATNIGRLVSGKFSGVGVNNYGFKIRGAISYALILLDGMPVSFDYISGINVHDIAQIDVLKNVDKTAIYGLRGVGGVIAFYTKRGASDNIVTPPFNIKTIMPLGYQKPVEFYAPKYDTPEKQNVSATDLRTTIHWQPVVQTDSLGVASFEFYTADETTSYTVMIEGLADDGKIIRQEGRLWRRE